MGMVFFSAFGRAIFGCRGAGMKKRVLVGGMHHESDTFNPITTSRDDIWVRRGEELLKGEREDSISGVIRTLSEAGYEVVTTLMARAVPNGEWDRAYYEELRNELLEDIRKALPLDAICLCLHGSMRVREIGEAEGDILERIRSICPDIPVFSTLDMHATITTRMLENCNGFVGYKCAPHTDTYETGIHAARMTIAALEKNLKPAMAVVHLPFLLAGEQSETNAAPMDRLMDICRSYERKPGVMACSYLLGFPWADTYENGVTALVVTEESQEEAVRYARELGDAFWKSRHEFCFYNETHEPEECLKQTRKSLEEGIYPVVISDSGDNPTAGSSQDVTGFLKLILEDEELSALDPPLVYQGFYDPVLCKAAFSAGAGGVVSGSLGACFDKKTSTPVILSAARVIALKAAWSVAGNADLALLEVNGVHVVVTSGHVGCYDPEMMRVLGIEPEKCKVIVVKLGYLEPEIRSIARRSMLALTEGSTDEVFSRLEYRQLKRPIFPLDGDITEGPQLVWGVNFSDIYPKTVY